jgi:hypothetical protein
MYTETTRKPNEIESTLVQVKATELKRSLRNGLLIWFACVMAMAPIMALIFWWNRAEEGIGIFLAAGFVVLTAVAGMLTLEEPVKRRKALQPIKAALETGSVIERHMVASRCFAILDSYREYSNSDEDDLDDPEESEDWMPSNERDISHYYLDVIDQGTLVISAHDISPPGFPWPEMDEVRLLDTWGRIVEKKVEWRGERISPMAHVSGRSLEGTPGLEGFASADSFSLFSDRFEDLLKLLQSA